MRGFAFCVLVSLLSSPTAPAADAPLLPADTSSLETIVVTGEQPGPGLWKVSKGDHVLWVLGTLSPLPEKIAWRADEVGQRIAQSQQVLKAPDVGLKANLGFFGRLALMPSLIGVRNNPDGRTLEEVVPPELYARWKPLKERYLGRSGKVEKWRPLFAAMELYRAAIRSNGMTVGSGAISDKVAGFSKRAKLEPVPVEVAVNIEKPRDAVKAFKKSSLDDLDCFAKTLDRLETDLGTMKRRANAWATGDLDGLRALPYTDQYAACFEAIRHATVMRDAGDLDARVEQAWLDAASKALEANASSFALLPMDKLLRADGYLSGLRARGYAVEAPDEVVPDVAAPDAAAP